jgi:hypothetical protein
VKERALPRSARADDCDHLSPLHGEIDTAENGDDIPIAADVGLVKVVCFEDSGRHSCLIASSGKRRDAWIDGYSVAIAAMAMLERTMMITSSG